MTGAVRSRRGGVPGGRRGISARTQPRRDVPLYARVLRLRHIAPSGFLCFVYLEGAVALGILLALAELVSWWGVLVLPAVVALMVKLNDVVAGLLARPAATAGRDTQAARDGTAWRDTAAGQGAQARRDGAAGRDAQTRRDGTAGEEAQAWRGDAAWRDAQAGPGGRAGDRLAGAHGSASGQDSASTRYPVFGRAIPGTPAGVLHGNLEAEPPMSRPWTDQMARQSAARRYE